MILDAIIAIFALLLDALVGVAVPCVNLVLCGIETIAGLFVAGFELGRWKPKRRQGPSVGGRLVLALLLGGLVWFLAVPRITNRTITLVAEDGHSLPFAALILHSSDGDDHRRTDRAGKVRVPRFRTKRITVKDPRYVEETWEFGNVGKELLVRRTVLGSGLDSLADHLMKPENSRK